MGAFYVDYTIESVEEPAKQLRIKKLLVDTGSEYTWLPEEDLKQLSISPRKKDVSFIMANG
ncbi:MAG: aspartyl protease family protein [Candidatus Neomarinimicrobiota bacterium]